MERKLHGHKLHAGYALYTGSILVKSEHFAFRHDCI
jgi:hypothetical protein